MRGVLFFCFYEAWLGEGKGRAKCVVWVGPAARTLNQKPKPAKSPLLHTKIPNLLILNPSPIIFCKNTFLFCKFLQKYFCKFYCTLLGFTAIFAALSIQNSIASSSILSLSLGNNHARQYIKSFPTSVLKIFFNISICFSSA